MKIGRRRNSCALLRGIIFIGLSHWYPDQFFYKCVLKYDCNKWVKHFSCWNQLMWMNFDCLSRRERRKGHLQTKGTLKKMLTGYSTKGNIYRKFFTVTASLPFAFMKQEPHSLLAGEEGFTGTLLDVCLAAGYYRSQHLMFTCNDTQVDENSYLIPAFWLRTRIKKIQEQKQALLIRKKCARFNVTVNKAAVTDEVEALYTLYRNHVPFSTSETCTSYLHQTQIANPFDSCMIEVRDGELLIAVGFFDKGSIAIAGIMNMYHPNYQQYSLGKYLMLKKIDAVKALGMTYYYTGYISTATTRFDYKAFPDANAVELYLPVEKQWIPYAFMDKEHLDEYYLNYLV